MERRTEIRSDLHTASVIRRLARSERNPRSARRMLALANAMDGVPVTDAARMVGIERQSLGDAVKRYNAEGLAGLFDRKKPAVRASSTAHKKRSFRKSSSTAPIPRPAASPPTRSTIL